jgi:hypothetical protein
MQRHIIDIRGNGIGYIESVTLGFAGLTEMFLREQLATETASR